MSEKSFNISSIAIIGGGPGGLTTLNELLNTSSDGTTTVHTDSRPVNPAFSKVVLFEQKDRVGGVWATDVDNPDVIPDEIFRSKEYYKSDVIQPKIPVPAELNETVNFEKRLVTEAVPNDLQWRRSGVYPGLYSNVPARFMRFSTIEYNADSPDPLKLAPLIPYQQITKTLTDFAEQKSLLDHVRLSSQVQNVRKDPNTNKWILTLRHNNKDTNKDEWYTESFDAVVVSSGHYSVPYIPYVEGLETRDPSSILHAKSFRKAEDFKDQTVLVVGSSLSGVDIIQYIYSVAKELYTSRTPGKEEIYPWLTRAANSVAQKPKIKRVEGQTVIFEDGSVLENVDKIIFATGYHWNYQFLPETVFNKSTGGYENQPTSASRVKGLYYDTFNIEDPTIGFVGIGLTAIKFHTLETSAAALAGVWSNIKKLPSKEEQYAWEAKRLSETAENVSFHYYPWNIVKGLWVDKVFSFAPIGRKNPIEDEDISDYDRGFLKAEEIFFALKDKTGDYAGL